LQALVQSLLGNMPAPDCEQNNADDILQRDKTQSKPRQQKDKRREQRHTRKPKHRQQKQPTNEYKNNQSIIKIEEHTNQTTIDHTYLFPNIVF
jgi:hypothetical protein